MEIKWIIVLTVLLVCSTEDLKYKSIPKILLVICGMAALITEVFMLLSGAIGYLDIILGTTVGIAVLAISIVTKGKIGLADGIIICICGSVIGAYRCLELLLCALMLSAVFSIILLFLKKVSLKQSMPFVPFLFIGSIICALL